jgi:hypothetical protein
MPCGCSTSSADRNRGSSTDRHRVTFPCGHLTAAQCCSTPTAEGHGRCWRSPQPGKAQRPLDWSRDGRFILYQTQGLSTRFDIWALPIAPRGKPFAVANTPRNERQAQLSPDSRWVAYTSDANGRDEVWVQAFPHAQDKWMVSTMGGSQPQWRRDGRELFYISSDRKLTAVDVKAAGSSFDAGVPASLFALKLADSLAARNNYMPSADGSRFLINTSYSGLGTRVAVVLDWISAMRER